MPRGSERRDYASARGYLAALGWKVRSSGADRVGETRTAIIEGIRASARGEIPAKGPRGGNRWPVRYFVRRVAWHVIAHAWEIERRSTSEDGT
jgi:hypothetical protein